MNYKPCADCQAPILERPPQALYCLQCLPKRIKAHNTESSRAYARRNPERVRAKVKRWYNRNPDRTIRRARLWREQHLDRWRAFGRKYATRRRKPKPVCATEGCTTVIELRQRKFCRDCHDFYARSLWHTWKRRAA